MSIFLIIFKFNSTSKTILCTWDAVEIPGIQYLLIYTTEIPPPVRDFHWSIIPEIYESFYEFGPKNGFNLVSGQSYTMKVKAISKFQLESAASNTVRATAEQDPPPEKLPAPAVKQIEEKAGANMYRIFLS